MNIDKYVKKEINLNTDNTYKEFSGKLCDTKYKMLGVRIPVLKKIAKDISLNNNYNFKEKLDYITNINDDCTFEEVFVKGFLIEYIKNASLQTRIEILEKYIPYIDNWSICDSVCANLKFINKNKEEILKVLEKYYKSDDEFYQRVAIVILMDYYITDEYIDVVLKIYKGIKLNGYYAKMALAWAISKIYIYYKDKALKFLQGEKLDDFTYNKSISKICDSLRVAKEEKYILRKMYKRGKV